MQVQQELISVNKELAGLQRQSEQSAEQQNAIRQESLALRDELQVQASDFTTEAARARRASQDELAAAQAQIEILQQQSLDKQVILEQLTESRHVHELAILMLRNELTASQADKNAMSERFAQTEKMRLLERELVSLNHTHNAAQTEIQSLSQQLSVQRRDVQPELESLKWAIRDQQKEFELAGLKAQLGSVQTEADSAKQCVDKRGSASDVAALRRELDSLKTSHVKEMLRMR